MWLRLFVATASSVLRVASAMITTFMGSKVWGGYQGDRGVTMYVRFFFCGRAAAHAHDSGSARARGRTGTQAALGSFSFARRCKIDRERRQNV